jgi:AI-2 transport protein TqsA
VPVIAVIAIPGMIQFLIGNFVEPKLLGQSLDLHPATILLSLMFWGLIWGATGMILAVPIMAVLRIALSRIENTKTIAELLSGRLPHHPEYSGSPDKV